MDVGDAVGVDVEEEEEVDAEEGVDSSGTGSPGCSIMFVRLMEASWAAREKVAFWLMAPIIWLTRQEPHSEQ